MCSGWCDIWVTRQHARCNNEKKPIYLYPFHRRTQQKAFAMAVQFGALPDWSACGLWLAARQATARWLQFALSVSLPQCFIPIHSSVHVIPKQHKTRYGHVSLWFIAVIPSSNYDLKRIVESFKVLGWKGQSALDEGCG